LLLVSESVLLIVSPCFSSTLSPPIPLSICSPQPLFYVYDDDTIHTYILAANNIRGPQSFKVASSRLPHGHLPLAVHDGVVTAIVQSGKVVFTHPPEQHVLDTFLFLLSPLTKLASFF
jgi:hypothetical protein